MRQEFSFDFFQLIATYIEDCEVIRNQTFTLLEIMLKEMHAWNGNELEKEIRP